METAMLYRGYIRNNGNYYSILGLCRDNGNCRDYWGNIEVILG